MGANKSRPRKGSLTNIYDPCPPGSYPVNYKPVVPGGYYNYPNGVPVGVQPQIINPQFSGQHLANPPILTQHQYTQQQVYTNPGVYQMPQLQQVPVQMQQIPQMPGTPSSIRSRKSSVCLDSQTNIIEESRFDYPRGEVVYDSGFVYADTGLPVSHQRRTSSHSVHSLRDC